MEANVLEAIQGLQQQLAAQQASAQLKEALEDSGLPVEDKRTIRKKFAGKTDLAGLDEAIEEAQERLKNAATKETTTATATTEPKGEETALAIVESAAPQVTIKPTGEGRWSVECEGVIIGKPASREEAVRMKEAYLVQRQYKIQESIDRIEAEYATRAKRAECRVILQERLAESGLPPNAIEKIKKSFETRVFESKELEDAINSMWDVLNPFIGNGTVWLPGQDRPFHVRMGESEFDKLCLALDGFWAAEDLKGNDGKPVRRFRSLQEAYLKITGNHWDPIVVIQELSRPIDGRKYDSHGRYGSQAGRVTEAISTSSFTQIFGDSITRRVIAEYRVPELQTWRRLVSEISSINDFRLQRRMRMGGYGLLPVVPEGISYTPLPSPTDEEATFQLVKRGGFETITLEALSADDMGRLRRIPQQLGRAAAQTLYRGFFDILDQNVALAYDGDTTALFTEAHGNLRVNNPLTVAGLDLAIQDMARQRAYGNATEFLGIRPRFLIHPTALWRMAAQLTGSPQEPFTAENQVNAFQQFGMERIEIPYWTSQQNWYLFADPRDLNGFEIGFYRGNEDPEIFIANSETDGGSAQYEADKTTYKIRHIWGIGIIDHRSVHANRF
jgi:hypothetical protein